MVCNDYVPISDDGVWHGACGPGVRMEREVGEPVQVWACAVDQEGGEALLRLRLQDGFQIRFGNH